MNELSRHIEVLLFENDCVIIPNFGGFVTYYTPSKRENKEKIFIPPTRVIGFNEQLQLNDGLLVQSFMAVYNTNFSDASKMIDKEVEKIKEKLFEEGLISFPNIGELQYTIKDTYSFKPFNNRLTTPSLYGLDTFQFLELQDLPKENSLVSNQIKNKRDYNIRINRSAVQSIASIAAVILLFFLLSKPIENTDIIKGNYAQLSFSELFNNIEEKPLTLSLVDFGFDKNDIPQQQPIKTREIKVPQLASIDSVTKTKEQEVTTRKAKANNTENPFTITKESSNFNKNKAIKTQNRFHVIVASSIPLKDAQAEVYRLKDLGYHEAQVVEKGNIIRISILNTTKKEEAYKELNKIRTKEQFHDAWMLIY